MMQLTKTMLGILLLVAGNATGAACSVKSPAHTVALIELYTSEGCSSCPPADKWLSSLASKGFRSDQIVPLTMHVDYWNYLGWSDPFSQAQFSARQREMAQLNRQRTVYTPQVMLQGEDYRGWVSNSAFASSINAINQRPAKAELNLSLVAEQNTFNIVLKGKIGDVNARTSSRAYIALYENMLSTQVPAGENAGRTLNHDHVVRALYGPFQVGSDGRIDLNRIAALDRAWNPAKLGVAAYVQDAQSGSVIQAVMLPACSS